MTASMPANSDTIAVLQSFRIRRSADQSVRKALARNSTEKLQKAWGHLLKQPARAVKSESESESFLSLWSADLLAQSEQDLDLAAAAATVDLHKINKGRQKDKRTEVCGRIFSSVIDDAQPAGFPVLLAAEALLRLPDAFSPDQFVLLVSMLACYEPHSEPVVAEPEVLTSARKAILFGELPFLISQLLHPLKELRHRGTAGAKHLQTLLDTATDTDGTCHASITRHLDRWLAPFVRTSVWSRAFGASWTGKQKSRWLRTIHGCVNLAIPGGQIDAANSPESESLPPFPELLRYAVRDLAPSSADVEFLQSVCSPASKKRRRKPRSTGSANSKRMSTQSDWASTALMRSGLQVDADVLRLNWDHSVPEVHLATLGSRVLVGAWSQSILLNGEPVEPPEYWSCTCWFDDKDVAFVELEAECDPGLRLVRHAMLSLDENFAVLSDSVTSQDANAELNVQSQLPLTNCIAVDTHPITRELTLMGDCHSVRLIPSWLEEDRIHKADGYLNSDLSQLELGAVGRGGVTLPLVLDWHPERMSLESDWNRLTVTESRQVMDGQKASGYRIRIGNYQMLLYRSLQAGQTLRTVMGLHTGNETVYGRVSKTGRVSPLILVDGETVESSTE